MKKFSFRFFQNSLKFKTALHAGIITSIKFTWLSMVTHIHPNTFKVSKESKINRLNQNPRLIWFTGLSGSGKSTLANYLEISLFENGFVTCILDGDNIRAGLNKDLGFSKEDRVENIRRIAEVAKLMMDSGLLVISAFISPFREERAMVEALVGEENFLEIFVDCPLEICEQRDVKGLYQKARNGIIRNFTGIDSPYEAPLNPSVHIYSDREDPQESIRKILESISGIIIGGDRSDLIYTENNLRQPTIRVQEK
jgi:adenylylsulfate kinase